MIEKTENNQSSAELSNDFDRLNNTPNGFQASDFILIHSRIEHGNTDLLFSMISKIAFDERNPVLLFSLEMQDTAIARHMINREMQVNIENNQFRNFTFDDFIRVNNTLDKMYESQFFINDNPEISYQEILSQARDAHEKEGIAVIFIHYLDIIRHDNTSLPRFEQIYEIYHSLNDLAKELKIPVVVSCELSATMLQLLKVARSSKKEKLR